MFKSLIKVILFIPVVVCAQSQNLEELKSRHEEENSQRLARVQEYSDKYNVPIMRQLSSGETIYLKDIVNGKAQFLKTDNSGARLTTGVDHLGVNGDLGLDLDGAGIAIAIWDGGLVRTSHNEFNGRVTPFDGSSSLNFHATHVMGTILASGANPGATGMAVNATAKSFDFFGDDGEMLANIEPDQSGIVLSNHSYGTITGWDDGVWFGDENISELEDYNFGRYNGNAALWDDMVFSSPYYTIVKSAGNDRGDSGDGTHPPDGPFDIISTAGTAKNIITIGAVNKLSEYTKPTDVVMSSFSGWGPTDDGRIKPDFVAAGVSVFSSFHDADDSYGTLQGTSMSAPNATGTFALLQQLHKKLNGGSLMKASELKALIAHTALEAGIHDGPDYAYGWGLIDGEKAAELLLKEDSEEVIIREYRLLDGQSIDIDFASEIGSEIKATICWTDPAGTVPPLILDAPDLNLVNDLDMRIASIDDTYAPWILNPAAPQVAATTGDNFRDNIEVIEFIPTTNDHSLTINHKGTLQGGFQDVTLVLTYEKFQNDRSIVYWVGEGGNPLLAQNWSLETGGNGGSIVPSNLSSVIFDNNSFSGENPVVITANGNLDVRNFVYLADQQVTFDLGSSDLTVHGRMSTNENLVFTGTGSVIFSSGDDNTVIGTESSLEDMHVVFNNPDGDWIISGSFDADVVELTSGGLKIENGVVSTSRFTVSDENPVTLTIDGSSLMVSELLDLSSDFLTFSDAGANIVAQGEDVRIIGDGTTSQASWASDGQLAIEAVPGIEELDFVGTLNLEGAVFIENLSSSFGSALELANGAVLELDDMILAGSEDNNFVISSDGAASLVFDGHRRLCFDFLEISDVNMTGESTVAVGENSVLLNASGWIPKACDDVLFALFSESFLCENSLVEFTNEGLGDYSEVEWDFAGQGTSEKENPSFVFSGNGSMTVSLTLRNGDDSNTYSRDILISASNDLLVSDISVVGEVLFSSEVADSYQWYRNGEKVVGATDRFHRYNEEEGTYFVVLYSETCNLPSNEIEILVAGLGFPEEFKVYPNPADDLVYINNENLDLIKVEISDINGKKVIDYESRQSILGIQVSDLTKGLYILRIKTKERDVVGKLMID